MLTSRMKEKGALYFRIQISILLQSNFQVPCIYALPPLSLPAHQARASGSHHGLPQQKVGGLIRVWMILFPQQVWPVHHWYGQGAEGGLGPTQPLGIYDSLFNFWSQHVLGRTEAALCETGVLDSIRSSKGGNILFGVYWVQWLTFKPGSPRSGVRFQEEPRKGEGSDRLQRDAGGAEQGAQQQVSSPGRIVVLTISHPQDKSSRLDCRH